MRNRALDVAYAFCLSLIFVAAQVTAEPVLPSDTGNSGTSESPVTLALQVTINGAATPHVIVAEQSPLSGELTVSSDDLMLLGLRLRAGEQAR